LRALIVAVLAVLRDLIRVGFRTRAQIIAENLFLRRQLALYQERKARRRRPTAVTKVTLVVLSRFFSWATALAIVKPCTFVRWHRFPTILAMEIATGRAPAATEEHTNADRHHGKRESELGRRADCQ